MSGPRVLFAINSLVKGGAQRLALDVCSECNRRNIENLLVTFSSINEYPGLSSGINIRQDKSRVYLKFSGKTVAEVNSFDAIVNEFKPDVIHSHLFYSDHISRQILHKGIAYFSHLHGRTTQYEPFSPGNLFQKKAWSEAITRAHIMRKYRECRNQFIANSTYVRKYIIDSLKLDPKDVHLLPNAIDLNRFTFSGKKISGEMLRLIYCGSLIQRKNPLLLPEIVVALQHRNYRVHLDILGEGPLRADLEQKIKALNLQPVIQLHGNVDRVEDYLRRADMYVHTALFEPFGLSLVEALATGLPVVCLDGKGNRDIMQNGYNGFMLEEHDPALFADRILQIIQTPGSYERFSRQAHQSSLRFNIRNYLDQLVQLYELQLSKLR